VYPSTLPSSAPPDAVVAELTAALFQLDPEDWRSEGSQESYDAWLGLMMACKAAGISEDDWVEWCMGDECYAGDEDEIRRKWEGVPARHADALFKALRGIRLSREVQEWRSAGVPLLPPATPTLPATRPPANVGRRSDGLLRWLRRNATADGLFSAACLFAEMGLTQDTTTRLVSGNLPSLRKALGDAEFTYQIARAFAHMAAKGATG
jgi:hypothetical protein